MHVINSQVYCQERELTEADFGDYFTTEECEDNLLSARRVTHETLIDQLDLVPEPVAANAIRVTYSEKADELVCDIQACVGFENYPINTSEGNECLLLG